MADVLSELTRRGVDSETLGRLQAVVTAFEQAGQWATLMSPHGLRTHIVYCFLSVTPSTKSTKFDGRYLGFRNRDEIWQIDRPRAPSSDLPNFVPFRKPRCASGLRLVNFGTAGHNGNAKILKGVKIVTLFSYIVWPSTITFSTVRGLVNGHLFPEFGELRSSVHGSLDTMRRHASVLHWCSCYGRPM